MNDFIKGLTIDPFKKIHGHAKLELFDAKTKHLIQKVEHDNMVTNALQILANNLAGGSDENISEFLMPVATRALGGLMMFDGALTEDVANVGFPADVSLKGWGNRGVNTTNTLMGSLNSAESGKIVGGYKSVWDFGTSQANGTIQSLALCNARVISPLSGMITDIDIHNLINASGDNWDGGVFHCDGEYVYAVRGTGNYTSTWHPASGGQAGYDAYTTTITIEVYRERVPLTKYKVADAVNHREYPEQLVTATVTLNDARYTLKNYSSPQDVVTDAKTGKAYLLYTAGNASGNARVDYVEINYSNLSNITISQLQNFTLGETYLNDGNGTASNGYFYFCANNRRGIYKVEIANTANVQLFVLPEGYWLTNYDGNEQFIINANPNGGVFFGCYTVASNGASGYYDHFRGFMNEQGAFSIDGQYWNRDSNTSVISHYLKYRNNQFLQGWEYGYNYGFNHYYYVGKMLGNYLGTICNLGTGIVKNASQTLKVTYTLTDGD